MENKLLVVLDTNALLVSISRKSKYRPIFDGLILGKYDIAITNEILNEYIEILERKTNIVVANNLAEFILNLPNVIKTEIHFNWQLINEDQDDNKFLDCAISSNAKYLVTNDKHFDILNQIEFPKIELIKIEEFLEEINQ